MAKATQPVSINGLEFDALISESRTLEATVPEYSVETGFSVSDSIILSPEKMEMTLFVTNTPVTWYRRHGAMSKLDRIGRNDFRDGNAQFIFCPVDFGE